MKIGVYGGAFNPVHNGHIKLAEYFREFLELDKVLFVPTANPPHRSVKDFVLPKDRLSMLNIALSSEKAFECSDIEFESSQKSYTYNTLCKLHEIYPFDDFYLLIGADQFLVFDSWYNAHEIVEIAAICTAARDNTVSKQVLLDAKKSMLVFSNANVYIADYSAVCVSSHEIRMKIKRNESISDYVDKNVEKYIKEKGLYSV